MIDGPFDMEEDERMCEDCFQDSLWNFIRFEVYTEGE